MNAVRKAPALPSRQAIDAAWQHYHYARHVQGMSNAAIMQSIGRQPTPGETVSQTAVITALEHTFIQMQLWGKE